MSTLIDGKAIAAKVREELKAEVDKLKAKGINPGLAVVLVGEDPASEVYVRNKGKACEKAGINSFQHILPAETSMEDLLSLIDKLNNDDAVNGILVQLPLPKHMDEAKVIEAITPSKDVDGFHPYSVGRLTTGSPTFRSCTPFGIIKLLEETIGTGDIKDPLDLSGKDAVVVGRSNIVGKPIALMLLTENATVTICHSRTKNLADKIRSADIVIAAVGIAEFVKGDWIKEGAVVIDVGINRTENGLVGDVEFDKASERASAITPVPGGVGPMTIAMLLYNTVESAKVALTKTS